MEENIKERIWYVYEFLFLNENDAIICHTEKCYVTDEFSAVTYAEDWLNKFSVKYGYCFNVIVYEENNPLNILLNIERKYY